MLACCFNGRCSWVERVEILISKLRVEKALLLFLNLKQIFCFLAVCAKTKPTPEKNAKKAVLSPVNIKPKA